MKLILILTTILLQSPAHEYTLSVDQYSCDTENLGEILNLRDTGLIQCQDYQWIDLNTKQPLN